MQAAQSTNSGSIHGRQSSARQCTRRLTGSYWCRLTAPICYQDTACGIDTSVAVDNTPPRRVRQLNAIPRQIEHCEFKSPNANVCFCRLDTLTLPSGCSMPASSGLRGPFLIDMFQLFGINLPFQNNKGFGRALKLSAQ